MPKEISLKLFIANVRLLAQDQLEGSTALDRQSLNIHVQSCCRSTWQYKSSSRQNTDDNDLLQTSAESQRPSTLVKADQSGVQEIWWEMTKNCSGARFAWRTYQKRTPKKWSRLKVPVSGVLCHGYYL